MTWTEFRSDLARRRGRLLRTMHREGLAFAGPSPLCARPFSSGGGGCASRAGRRNPVSPPRSDPKNDGRGQRVRSDHLRARARAARTVQGVQGASNRSPGRPSAKRPSCNEGPLSAGRSPGVDEKAGCGARHPIHDLQFRSLRQSAIFWPATALVPRAKRCSNNEFSMFDRERFGRSALAGIIRAESAGYGAG